MKTYKWAILTTGYIAHRFVQGARLLPEADIACVCSRTMENAVKFADEYGIKGRYDDYEKMLKEVQPDIVYVATPNIAHYDYVMTALDMGINVLCEKPMADHIPQQDEMYAKAKEKNLFLMEGMWTRCFPAVRKAKEWIDSGRIGKVLHVTAELCFQPEDGNWQPWKAEAELAAGAIRDLGIYTLAMAFLGIPEKPKYVNSAFIPYRGADMRSEFFLEYEGGRTAFLRNAMDSTGDPQTTIVGETGYIKIGRPELIFFSPDTAVLYKPKKGNALSYEEAERFYEPYEATGFQFEAKHVMECMDAGKKTSDWFTVKESREIGTIIDDFRRKSGIRYTSDPKDWWLD